MIRKGRGKITPKRRRVCSIRKKIMGSATRPRVNINRSCRNIFVQVIDDSAGITLLSVGTFGKKAPIRGGNVESGKGVGAILAKKLKDRQIETVVFDRNGHKYHGVVAAGATGLREGGVRV